jgi:RimJ/RimL family protein N-acetyltransferase
MTITLTREEAQQVLDALEEGLTSKEYRALVETLRARLSAPEPEPVAWMQNDMEHFSLWPDEWHVVPLYTTPPQREWQGLTDEEMSAAMDYWSDPVRSAYGGAHSADGEYVGMIDTWRYIEAKLKEKNT